MPGTINTILDRFFDRTQSYEQSHMVFVADDEGLLAVLTEFARILLKQAADLEAAARADGVAPSLTRVCVCWDIAAMRVGHGFGPDARIEVFGDDGSPFSVAAFSILGILLRGMERPEPGTEARTSMVRRFNTQLVQAIAAAAEDEQGTSVPDLAVFGGIAWDLTLRRWNKDDSGTLTFPDVAALTSFFSASVPLQPAAAVDGTRGRADEVPPAKVPDAATRPRVRKPARPPTPAHAQVSERPIDADSMAGIRQCADDALELLGLSANEPDPGRIVEAIDAFVHQWQRGMRVDPELMAEEDGPLLMGSLWGQTLVRRFGWEWAMVTFHDHGDSAAPGVLSPDRSLAIYPIHFLMGCIQDPGVDATILLAYNMLDAGTIPNLAPRGYRNLMDGVHRIIPRA